ncbi:hypothetical protein [Anaerosolibacter sp.]|uniref:hypothetical protein n=1 Tax=Anaerosolibacter sp. TaxID=1872527 RepID=UPI0039EE8DEE
MNRKMRRKQDKKLKKILTDEQFSELKEEATNQIVEQKVDDIWRKMSGVLVQIMRENRISQERIAKIVSEFSEEIEKQFGGAENA